MVVRYHIKVDLNKKKQAQQKAPSKAIKKSSKKFLENREKRLLSDDSLKTSAVKSTSKDDVFTSQNQIFNDYQNLPKRQPFRKRSVDYIYKKSNGKINLINLVSNKKPKLTRENSLSMEEFYYFRRAILLISLGFTLLISGLAITFMHFSWLYKEEQKVKAAKIEKEKLEKQQLLFIQFQMEKFEREKNISLSSSSKKDFEHDHDSVHNNDQIQQLFKVEEVLSHGKESTVDYLFHYLMKIIGPIVLALGILIMICGVVWMPVIRDKFKKMRLDRERKSDNGFGWRFFK